MAQWAGSEDPAYVRLVKTRAHGCDRRARPLHVAMRPVPRVKMRGSEAMNPPPVFSTEVRLALAPASTYRELTARKAPGSWLVAFKRPAFTALLIGALVAIASTGRVTLGLVSSL